MQTENIDVQDARVFLLKIAFDIAKWIEWVIPKLFWCHQTDKLLISKL